MTTNPNPARRTARTPALSLLLTTLLLIAGPAAAADDMPNPSKGQGDPHCGDARGNPHEQRETGDPHASPCPSAEDPQQPRPESGPADVRAEGHVAGVGSFGISNSCTYLDANEDPSVKVPTRCEGSVSIP